MTNREATIARLEQQKAELSASLRRATRAWKVDQQWFGDRIRELANVNHELARLGAKPAPTSKAD